MTIRGPNRKHLFSSLFICTSLFFSLFIKTNIPDASSSSLSPDPYYEADGFTLLFDNFEATTFADSLAASVSYSAGYLEGNSLKFSDTNSFALYSDSWWIDPGEQVSDGTVECFFKPDTFIYTGAQSYASIFTTDERPNTPTSGGYPTLAVFEDGNVSWSISKSPTQYAEASYPADPDSPPLYPGQWYHLSAVWTNGNIKLYINGFLSAEADFDTYVLANSFQLGSQNLSPSNALAARGLIDRFRLSSVARAASQFPSALDVRIDAPSSAPGGVDLAKPFSVVARAYASDTRTRRLNIYTDTDASGFNGTILASDLPESGTFLLGGALPDSSIYLYAVATAGNDSAYYYYPFPFNLIPSESYSAVIDPTDTSCSVSITPSSTDSFMLILLNGGGTTDSPAGSADSSGTGANYKVEANLIYPSDTADFYIWTKQTTGGIMIALRSDSTNLNTSYLPRGIPVTDTGLKAFSRTIILTEFLKPDGTIIGDTNSTAWIGDSYSYTIHYRLSQQTTYLYNYLGFDTSPGSAFFAFFYADTYSGKWIEDTTVTVTVQAGANGGIIVICSGITKDLPGGLGQAAGSGTISIIGVDKSSACILENLGLPDCIINLLRLFRDMILNTLIGRILTAVYY